jgi:hypothetical protein
MNKPADDGKAEAEKSVSKYATTFTVGIASAVIAWQLGLKEIVYPVLQNIRDVEFLKRDTSDNRARIEALERDRDKFFPRSLVK